MEPKKRLEMLRETGKTLRSIADELVLSHVTVGEVLRGNRRSKRVEDFLSALLGLPPEKIWPEWYGGDLLRKEAQIDVQLLGEVRRAMLHFGLAQGCALPIAIPRLRHVAMVYNAVKPKLLGNESIGESAKVLQAEVERYARALIDPDDTQMFGRNWWEPLESFANPGVQEAKQVRGNAVNVAGNNNVTAGNDVNGTRARK